MKKLLCLVVFACLLTPAMGFAGVEGRYDFDKQKMLDQVLPIIIAQKKIPPAMHKVVRAKMKERLDSRDMWMVLSPKGVFQGWMLKKGVKKAKLGATGTWSIKGKKLTIESESTDNKKKTTMHCTIGKNTLSCTDSRNPKLSVHFNKK